MLSVAFCLCHDNPYAILFLEQWAFRMNFVPYPQDVFHVLNIDNSF